MNRLCICINCIVGDINFLKNAAAYLRILVEYRKTLRRFVNVRNMRERIPATFHVAPLFKRKGVKSVIIVLAVALNFAPVETVNCSRDIWRSTGNMWIWSG